MKNAAHTSRPEPTYPQPVLDREPPSRVEGFAGQGAPGRPLRILLVEDDARLRVTLRACLNREGFAVVECETGQEALERARPGTHPGTHFDLLLTDFEMPGLTGLQLAEELTVLAR